MADLFPCPNKSDCAEEAADLVVRRNFTAELPDRNLAFSIFYPPLGFPGFPPPGATTASFCSASSQQNADICSIDPPNNGFGTEFPTVYASSAQECSVSCPGGGVVTFSSPPALFFANTQSLADQLALDFACEAAQLLCTTPLIVNTDQTCTVTCEDGSTESYTVLAGSFTAQTQSEANGLAMTLACTVANALCSGIPITLFASAPQSCTIQCASGAFTYTVPAGVAHGLTQAEANAAAAALACVLAASGCSNLPPFVGNTAQTCSQDCDGTIVTYTIPANTFQALDQATANLIAFALACAALSQSCQEGTTPPPVTAPNTQQSCSIGCDGGGSFTYVVPYNTYRADNQAAANAVAQTAACNLAAIYRTCVTAVNDTACASAAYNRAINASGPLSGNMSSVVLSSGTLPPGVSIFGQSLTGIPVTGGTYSFVLRVNFAGGSFALQPCTIRVIQITGSLSAAQEDVAYSDSISVVGVDSPTLIVVGGLLPPGIGMSGAGVFSGTPTAQGTYNFVVQVSGTSCTRQFSLTVTAPVASCPDWSTLLWGSPIIIGASGGATGSMAPDGVAGDTFTMAASVPMFPPDFFLVQGANSGQLNYNGSGCNCKLVLDFAGVFSHPTEISCTVAVEQNGVPVLGIAGTLGVNTHFFTLNDTGGGTDLIEVFITMQCHNTVGGGPSSMNVTGVLSNV